MAVESKSASKVLTVLRVLERNFAHGFSAGELAEATGFSASDITRFVNTLEKEGYAERIVETKRIRPAMRYAKVAVSILADCDKATERFIEIKTRLSTGITQ